VKRLRMAIVGSVAAGFVLMLPGVAAAATTPFTVKLNRIGSITDPQAYVTTSQFRDINVRLTSNPRDTYVKPVRCDGRGDISTAKFFRANDHRVRVIASNVRDGTCFRLNFDAPTLATFTVAGRVSY
jgi:hypothetical protein